MKIPILYTFRRCPYAIRARMALYYSGIKIRIREIVLKHKPQQMLAVSPKGTVPVLVLADGTVIEESLDIMRWALQQSDPDGWVSEQDQTDSDQLIYMNDHQFKPLLDNYKYPQRSEKQDPAYYRDQTQPYLNKLNQQLGETEFLLGSSMNLTDVALFPFIRQFALVDKEWFDQAPYPHLQAWLHYFLDNELFQDVMQKYQPWSGEDEPIL